MGADTANVLSDPGAHPVIAHRGNSAHYPENTAPAFDSALALGVDALEFDVRISRDGVVVVIHDPTLDRTTNGTGAVESLGFAELQTFDVGARFTRDGGRTFPFRGSGLRILSLEELLLRYETIPLLIEVKIAAAVDETRRLIERHGCEDRVLMDSTALDAVRPFRGTALSTGASFRDVVALLPWCIAGRCPTALSYSALCIPPWYNGFPVPVRRLAQVARSRDIPTHVWTINDPAEARTLWQSGINGIITDDPEPMLKVRRELFSTDDRAGRSGRHNDL